MKDKELNEFKTSNTKYINLDSKLKKISNDKIEADKQNNNLLLEIRSLTDTINALKTEMDVIAKEKELLNEKNKSLKD